MTAVLILLACYLFGAVPFGLIVGKVTRGIDIRDFGSGNIGASNVLRTLGVGPAILVFVLDTVKGLAAVLLCRHFSSAVPFPHYFVVAGALLSVVGHSFSVFLKFGGGKGVATSLGVFIGLSPMVAGIGLAIWLLMVAVSRYISVGAILAAICVPVMMFVFPHPFAYRMLAIVAGVGIIFKHRSNIGRLLAGTEAKIGQKADIGNKTEG